MLAVGCEIHLQDEQVLTEMRKFQGKRILPHTVSQSDSFYTFKYIYKVCIYIYIATFILRHSISFSKD